MIRWGLASGIMVSASLFGLLETGIAEEGVAGVAVGVMLMAPHSFV